MALQIRPHHSRELSASLNPLAPPFLPDSGRQTNKTPNLNPLADSFSPSVPLPSPTHPSALRVLFLNIRSLRNKLNDILLLTQQLNAPDIVCVNETWLDATVSDQEIALTGYSVTRRDRSGGVGGGVCIYWKSCLPVKPRDDITTDGVESCWCEVACRPRSCLVGTIYRPPSEPVGYWDKLDEHLCAALRPQPNAIVCGDFNVNIDLSARDPQYHYLSDLLNSYALHHGVNKSTRFSSTGQDSTLDLILNNFDPSTTAKIIPVAFSDHAAVASDFHLIVPRGSDTTRLYRNYHRINHDHFRRDLTQKNLCSITGNPSAMWTEWSSRFIEVLDVHAPLQSNHRTKKPSVPWIDRQLLYLLHKRNRLHRKWLSAKTQETYAEFSTAGRAATSYNRTRKQEFYNSKFQQCTGNARETWKIIKELTGKQSTYRDPQCTVDAIRDTFSKVVEDPARPAQLRLPLGPPPAVHFSEFLPVSIATTRKMLEQLDTRKATGSDDIPASLLQMHADILAPSLTLLFNKSLREGQFPAAMKVGKIRPLFKAGDPSQPKNYRPVSLLPIVSKVLERIVHKQLLQYLNTNNFLPTSQFGYRHQHSTADALALAVENINEAQAAGQHTGVAFVDMSKAFDKVKHSILVEDLFELGLTSTALQWFSDYLMYRRQYVETGKTRSTTYDSQSGVPQGLVLGPLLFVLYVRDIAGDLAPHDVTTIQFADDISLRASSPQPEVVSQRLTAAVQYLATWLKKRGLILNETKTQILAIPHHRAAALDINVVCNSQVLPVVTSAKYLGLHFDSDMSWTTMVDHVARRVAGKIAVLLRHASSLPYPCRLTYFRSIVLPEFLYASISYYPYLTVAQEQRLHRLFKRAARAVCKSPPWTSTAPLLNRMHVCDLQVSVHLNMLCFIWRCLHDACSTLFESFLLSCPQLALGEAKATCLWSHLLALLVLLSA